MKQTLIKQLIKLEKAFLLNNYAINPIIKGDKKLIITITLKEGDKDRLIRSWDCVRRIE